MATLLVQSEDGVSKYQIHSRLGKLVKSYIDLSGAAVDGMTVLRLQRAESRREVTNNISDLCMVVEALERGEFEFPSPTAKEVCCCILCQMHVFMRLRESGTRALKQESRPLTPPITPTVDFAKKAVQCSERFDSDNDEVPGKVKARQSRMMGSATRRPMCFTLGGPCSST